MAVFIHLRNPRLRTKAQRSPGKVSRRCFHFHSLFLPFCPSPCVSFSLSLSCFPLFSFLSSVWLFLLRVLFAVCQFMAPGTMAHSSAHTRAVPERSRSRDDPMWQPRPSQHRNPYRDSWQDVPSPPRLRNGLVIVDLEGVRSHMLKVHDGIMESTTCDVLPALSRTEELALFTYNVLLTTQRLDTFTVHNLLYTISQLYVGPLPSSFFNGHSLAR
jgi:hypothetical protein